MIRVQDLVFSYPGNGFRLRIPDLRIPSGDTVAFVGPSGTGKTTLLNLLAGISIPERGVVEVAGARLDGLSDAGLRAFRIANIGLVFQEFELLGYLSVLDNILLPYRIHPALHLDDVVRDRALSLARDVGIADKVSRFPDRLSQGERQRVAVCRAVLPQPAILLADEPTGNLDPDNTDRVLEILTGYVRSRGATLVAVTHDHGLLSRFGTVIDFRSFQEPAGAS